MVRVSLSEGKSSVGGSVQNDGMWIAVTRNLAQRDAATRWLQNEIAGPASPDVIFLQEVPAPLVRQPPAGYVAIPKNADPSRGRVSMLLISERVRPLVTDKPAAFSALGSYAAHVRVQLPGGMEVLLASVHVRPSSEGVQAARPTGVSRRSCETRPWWSDVVMAELADLPDTPAIIAGDFNQAYAWDDDHPGHECQQAFFAHASDLGLVDVTMRDWGRERPTRRRPDYQLDRIFASTSIAGRVVAAPEPPAHDDATDHAPIRFTIR